MGGAIFAMPRVKARAILTAWADATPKSFSNCYAARDSLKLNLRPTFPNPPGLRFLSCTPKDYVIGFGGVRVPMRPLSGLPGFE